MTERCQSILAVPWHSATLVDVSCQQVIITFLADYQPREIKTMNRFRTVMLFVPLVVFPLLFSGCNQEGIWVSRSELNFERDTNPQFFSVANINPELGTINVIIEDRKSVV